MSSQTVEPHLFVIFGATGDLMRRKLLPALYNLGRQGRLGERYHLLGVARSPWDDEQFRDWAREGLEATAGANDFSAWCDHSLSYHAFLESDSAAFQHLKERIETIEGERELPGNRTFYLALPPIAFAPTIEGLGEAGLNRSPGWTRLVVEKPFGHDLASAEALNQVVHRHFREEQVYRIDHYLGKETVQNLLVFRFANPLFESVWNRDRVKSVQITVAESLGIGRRAGYYERAGALRDMVQNHLMQLLTLTAMEPPAAFEADAIRSEKVKVLHSVVPPRPEDVVLGQYTAGKIDGEAVVGYHDEADVPTDSDTETFAALRLSVQSWRWQGVPFYLRTGKRMERRVTEIVIRFRRAPVALFQPFDSTDLLLGANAIVLTLQPDEGFKLHFDVKTPGHDVGMETQQLRFSYSDAFGAFPDAYETLLLDVLTGDQMLFVHADEVEAAWRLMIPTLEHDNPVHAYEAGTWGPAQALNLPGDDGDDWMTT